jgi:rubredoxin
MPWKCPACETEVRHDEIPAVAGRVYRCSVCHLELTHDAATDRMQVAPLPERPAPDRPGT